jgi:hypothetical protein
VLVTEDGPLTESADILRWVDARSDVGLYGVPLPPLEALPEPFAGELRVLREHPAGAFALRLYDQERPYTPGR